MAAPAQGDDDSVNLVNPSGQLVSVPQSQAKSALGFGYRQPSADDIKDAQNKETYGTGVGNELKAAGLGAAGSFSFGVIPEALAKSGAVPSEEQAALAKYNPRARLAGEGLGVAAGIAGAILTGGGSEVGAAGAAGAEGAAGLGLADALNPISAVGKFGKSVSGAAAKALPGAENASFARAVLSRAGAASAGAAAEGAVFGAGQSLDEHAMGDPDAMGEHLLHNIGYGAALAGLAGGGLSVGGDLFGKLKGTIKEWKNPSSQAEGYRQNIRVAAEHEAGVPAPDGPISADPAAAGAPGSLEDIQSRIKNATYQGINPGELPAKAALVDAAKTAGDLDYPVHNIQLESLSDARTRDYYKALLESQTDEAQALKTYESLQKQELTRKLGSEVESISPAEALTDDPTKGGESLVKGFTDHYQTEKDALKPLFKEFDKVGANPLASFAANPAPLDDAIEGASQYLKVKDGKLEIEPFRPSMPFSKAAHAAMEDLIDAANDPKMTLDGVRNVRESIRDRIKLDSAPREVAQLGALRKTLMDYMQEAVEEHTDDLNVRDTFKRYAINEQNRAVMEKVFGGSISDRATFAKMIKSEDVLDKLFANSVSVKAAKDILPAKTFNKAVGDYLSMKKTALTDTAKNGFSSNRFSTFLRSKSPELSAALADNPQALAKMNAYTDIMRILPDSPSINPSGTAKTLNLLGVINKIGSAVLHPIGAAQQLIGGGLQGLASRTEQNRVKSVLNEILAGKSAKEAEIAAQEHMAKNSILGVVQKASEKAAEAISKGAKSIFGVSGAAVPAAAALGSKKDSSHKNVAEQLHSLNDSPTGVLDRLNDQTKLMYAHAPQSTSSLNQSLIRANQFLTSKLPQLPPQMPLSPKFEPSKAAVAKFERYSIIVEDPLLSMGQIKDGTITLEAVEAIKTVYPKMYDQMRAAIVDQLAEHKSKDGEIPYRTKLGLSLFMGQPMDATMTPQSIMSHQGSQAAAAPPQGQAKPKGALSKLGKTAALYATGDQAMQMERGKHAS